MNSQKPTIYLHIGIHKTGSTSIQMALHTHREDLLKAGVLYPSLNDNYNHRMLAEYLQSPDGDKNLSNWFAGIAAKVDRSSIRQVVVSAELLYYPKLSELVRSSNEKKSAVITEESYLNRLLKLKSSIPDLFDNKIVIYLRRQDVFIESAYYQMVKGVSAFTGSIKDTVEGLSTYMDYYLMLSYWAEVFGKENILVRVYEKQQLPGGSIKDFLQVINLESAVAEKILTSTNNYNMRLGREILDYKLILNRIMEKEDPVRLDQLHYTLLEELSGHPGFNEYDPSLLSPEEKHEIIQRYAEGNAKIAREYLGREDGRLFLEPEKTVNNGLPYKGLSVERAVDIGTHLSFLLIDKYEERAKAAALNSVFSYPDLLDAQSFLNIAPMKFLVKIFSKFKNERDLKIIRRSGLFDASYYLENNPDVAARGLDALRHFVFFGWKEVRRPNMDFNIAEYILKYPEFIKLGINPLVHYITRQKTEKG